MSDLIGTKLGDRYRLDLVIGQGGSGTIFKAYDDQLGRDVAIKLLKSGGDKAERLRTRFKTEALAAGRIQHPNIIAIYDVNVKEGVSDVYMVMELLHGWDLLNELHHNGPLDPARALALFIPCLRGLAKCHLDGVVHKDLKPSNLFIREAGTPDESMCLLDFGVARLMEGERITRVGGVAGTPRYLAPEYIRDASVSPTVDVYQMGLILVESLTGNPCIPKGETEFQTFQRHLKGDLDLPQGLSSGRFAAVVQRALCVDAEVRYQDAGVFADSLEMVPPDIIAASLVGSVRTSTIAPEMTTVISDVTQSGPHAKLTQKQADQAVQDLPVAKEVTAWFSAIRADSDDTFPKLARKPTGTVEDRPLQARMEQVRESSTEVEPSVIDEDDLGAFVMGAQAPLPTLVESSEFKWNEVRKSGEFAAPDRTKPPSTKNRKAPQKRASKLPVIGLFLVFTLLVAAAVVIFGFWYYYV